MMKDENDVQLHRVKLAEILEECDKHISRIDYDAIKMSAYMPISDEKIEKLTDEEIAYIDQLVFRFTKLQDVMGKKLFPYILINLYEDIREMPFIDILNRLEKLKIIENASEWKRLREIRNELSHEYSSHLTYLVEGLNKLYQNIPTIKKIYEKVKYYAEKKKLTEIK